MVVKKLAGQWLDLNLGLLASILVGQLGVALAWLEKNVDNAESLVSVVKGSDQELALALAFILLPLVPEISL